MEGQCKIVVRLRIARLRRTASINIRLRHADVAGLQQHQPEIVVGLREIRIGRTSSRKTLAAPVIVILAEDQSQLYPGVSVLGIQN